jgi:hypothetical protein
MGEIDAILPYDQHPMPTKARPPLVSALVGSFVSVMTVVRHNSVLLSLVPLFGKSLSWRSWIYILIGRNRRSHRSLTRIPPCERGAEFRDQPPRVRRSANRLFLSFSRYPPADSSFLVYDT